MRRVPTHLTVLACVGSVSTEFEQLGRTNRPVDVVDRIGLERIPWYYCPQPPQHKRASDRRMAQQQRVSTPALLPACVLEPASARPVPYDTQTIPSTKPSPQIWLGEGIDATERQKGSRRPALATTIAHTYFTSIHTHVVSALAPPCVETMTAVGRHRQRPLPPLLQLPLLLLAVVVDAFGRGKGAMRPIPLSRISVGRMPRLPTAAPTHDAKVRTVWWGLQHDRRVGWYTHTMDESNVETAHQ